MIKSDLKANISFTIKNSTLLLLLHPAPALRTQQLETIHVCLLADQLLVSNIALVHLHVHHTHHQDDGGHGEDGDDGEDHSSSSYFDIVFSIFPVNIWEVQLTTRSTFLAESSVILRERHGRHWALGY